MENLTARELRDNLDFSQVIEGIEVSITEGHNLFESNLQSWLLNRVSEDWRQKGVILSPEDGDAFYMEKEEYNKL